MNKLIKLGNCSKPHGIKGAFTFNISAEDSSLLKQGSKILLFPNSSSSSIESSGETHTISEITFGHKVMVYLDGIDNRNTVEEMIPFEIMFEKGIQANLDDDEVYLDDLKGFLVLDEDDEEIGKIQAFSDNGVQSIIEVRGLKNFDIPYVDQFVIETNLEKKYIKVIVPDYV